MLTPQTELETIEMTIEEAKKQVALMETYQRLLNNPDYQAIFSKGLFEEEAIRVVRARAYPHLQSEDQQMNLVNRLNTIGDLQMYLLQINQMGQTAERGLVDHYKAKDEILEEQLGAVNLGDRV